MSDILIVVDGKPMRAVSVQRTVETVLDGIEGGFARRSILPNSGRTLVATRDARWMLFKDWPKRYTRPSGRLVYVFGKPDSTYVYVFGKPDSTYQSEFVKQSK